MKRKSNFNTDSPLLQLLDQRFSSLSLGDGKAYRRPRAINLAALKAAADAHADVNQSDPFARARIVLHMRQGYALISDVLADAKSKQRARQDANVRDSQSYAA
jgi:hypothetical protein